MTTTLRFFKLDDRWYADVPNHTLHENEMVAGSDDFLNACDRGTGNVVIEMSDCQIGVPKLWICNVTHDVMGEHPRDIFIQSIQ